MMELLKDVYQDLSKKSLVFLFVGIILSMKPLFDIVSDFNLHTSMISLTVFTQFILNTSIIILFILLFKSRINKNDIFISFFLGTFLELIGVFSDFIPSLIIGTYMFITGEFLANFTAIEVGPKYIFYFIIILCMFYVLYKKEKTLDRIIIQISSLAMIITVFLFHFLVVNISVYDSKHRRFQMIESVSKIESISDFNQSCEYLNLLCFNKKKGDDFIFVKDINNAYINERIEYIYKHGNETTLPTKYEPTYDINIMTPWEGDDKIFEGADEVGYLGLINRDVKNGTYKVVIDTDWQIILDKQQMIIIVLVLTAHVVWVFGGLYLINLHNKRKMKNIKLVRRADNAKRTTDTD